MLENIGSLVSTDIDKFAIDDTHEPASYYSACFLVKRPCWMITSSIAPAPPTINKFKATCPSRLVVARPASMTVSDNLLTEYSPVGAHRSKIGSSALAAYVVYIHSLVLPAARVFTNCQIWSNRIYSVGSYAGGCSVGSRRVSFMLRRYSLREGGQHISRPKNPRINY